VEPALCNLLRKWSYFKNFFFPLRSFGEKRCQGPKLDSKVVSLKLNSQITAEIAALNTDDVQAIEWYIYFEN